MVNYKKYSKQYGVIYLAFMWWVVTKFYVGFATNENQRYLL